MATDDLLKQGIATLKAGRKAEAHKLLMQVTQQDERNETAWLWLSGAVDTDEERRTCLENVLAINPNNGVARRGLESLIAKEGVRPLGAVSSLTPRAEPIATPREQPAPRPAAVSAPDVARRKKPRKPPTARRQPDNSGTKRQHSRQNMVKIARAAALGIILFFVSLVHHGENPSVVAGQAPVE